VPVIAAAAQAIPDSQVDTSRVYYGSTAAFDNPAEVDIEAAVHSTPEYQEIVKKKIDSGTGKYWILISDATDRVHRAISEVGKVKDFDLIAEKGYLGKLDPPVACADITARVLEAVAAE
jgi:hypothetical protein